MAACFSESSVPAASCKEKWDGHDLIAGFEILLIKVSDTSPLFLSSEEDDGVVTVVMLDAVEGNDGKRAIVVLSSGNFLLDLDFCVGSTLGGEGCCSSGAGFGVVREGSGDVTVGEIVLELGSASRLLASEDNIFSKNFCFS